MGVILTTYWDDPPSSFGSKSCKVGSWKMNGAGLQPPRINGNSGFFAASFLGTILNFHSAEEEEEEEVRFCCLPWTSGVATAYFFFPSIFK